MAGKSAATSDTIGPYYQPLLVMNRAIVRLTILTIFLCVSVQPSVGQSVTRDLTIVEGGTITVKNLSGRVAVVASAEMTVARLTATSEGSIAESELKVDGALGNIRIETVSSTPNKRIDISLAVPERIRLKITTEAGEIRVAGDLASVEATTDTGTIAADVPKDDLKYSFVWTASRPRYLNSSNSSGSANLMRTIHASPNGSSFTSSGWSIKSSLTAMISSPCGP